MIEVLKERIFVSKSAYLVMDNVENNDLLMDSPNRELARD
jgi:hypothetical protein